MYVLSGSIYVNSNNREFGFILIYFQSNGQFLIDYKENYGLFSFL